MLPDAFTSSRILYCSCFLSTLHSNDILLLTYNVRSEVLIMGSKLQQQTFTLLHIVFSFLWFGRILGRSCWYRKGVTSLNIYFSFPYTCRAYKFISSLVQGVDKQKTSNPKLLKKLKQKSSTSEMYVYPLLDICSSSDWKKIPWVIV